MTLPSTFLARCTTRIVGQTGDGRDSSYGTGFFYTIGVGSDRSLLAIITNKHVVQGCASVRIVTSTVPSSADVDERHCIV